MRQYIDVTGKTEEEAINAALAQLSMDRDDVSVELLERAKAGFLGLGSCPAKVPGSFHTALLDAAGTLTPADLAAGTQIQEISHRSEPQ